jgi:hypothetical protein
MLRLSLVLGLGLLLGGCASYDVQVERGKSLAGVQRFFVVSNLNDNHALDHRIAEAIKARGFEAEIGPLTMMPDNTQAIVTFQDRWAWDFGDHLVYLSLNAQDATSHDTIAVVSFNASIPLREPVPATVGQLVDRLLASHPATTHAGLRPAQDSMPGPKKRARE